MSGLSVFSLIYYLIICNSSALNSIKSLFWLVVNVIQKSGWQEQGNKSITRESYLFRVFSHCLCLTVIFGSNEDVSPWQLT